MNDYESTPEYPWESRDRSWVYDGRPFAELIRGMYPLQGHLTDQQIRHLGDGLMYLYRRAARWAVRQQYQSLDNMGNIYEDVTTVGEIVFRGYLHLPVPQYLTETIILQIMNLLRMAQTPEQLLQMAYAHNLQQLYELSLQIPPVKPQPSCMERILSNMKYNRKKDHTIASPAPRDNTSVLSVPLIQECRMPHRLQWKDNLCWLDSTIYFFYALYIHQCIEPPRSPLDSRIYQLYHTLLEQIHSHHPQRSIPSLHNELRDHLADRLRQERPDIIPETCKYGGIAEILPTIIRLMTGPSMDQWLVPVVVRQLPKQMERFFICHDQCQLHDSRNKQQRALSYLLSGQQQRAREQEEQSGGQFVFNRQEYLGRCFLITGTQLQLQADLEKLQQDYPGDIIWHHRQRKRRAKQIAILVNVAGHYVTLVKVPDCPHASAGWWLLDDIHPHQEYKSLSHAVASLEQKVENETPMHRQTVWAEAFAYKWL